MRVVDVRDIDCFLFRMKGISLANDRFTSWWFTGKQKKAMQEISGEVIQIGAVMLDEQFNYLSQFSIFVKPVYGVISAESVDNPDFYKDSLEHADTFSTASEISPRDARS